LGKVAERAIYECLVFLPERLALMESALARRHTCGAILTCCGVRPSYLFGRCIPSARHGYDRDHRPDRRQIVYSLLCNLEGFPVAIEVFDGNNADPATLAARAAKVNEHFGMDRVAVVGVRGMITSAGIRDHLTPAGLDWISAPQPSDDNVQQFESGLMNRVSHLQVPRQKVQDEKKGHAAQERRP